MSNCKQCNAPLIENARFCNICGYPVSEETALKEEQEFLNTTHRLLRWEQKAWRICGVVMLIIGCFFAGTYSLIGLIGIISGANSNIELYSMFVLFFIYAFWFGGIFIAIGVIGIISCKKIPAYLNTMHYDLTKTVNRSGNIGMLVFTAFFSGIAFIFFLINFIRIKSNANLITRIINKQQNNI